jgi:hypothetical protein
MSSNDALKGPLTRCFAQKIEINLNRQDFSMSRAIKNVIITGVATCGKRLGVATLPTPAAASERGVK